MNTVVSVASLASAAAIPSPSIARIEPDAQLRQLWTEYLCRYEVADAAYGRARALRAPYDAEMRALSESGAPASGEVHEILWAKHGLEGPWQAYNDAFESLRLVIQQVHATPAETLFGVGVKLSVVPRHAAEGQDPYDIVDGVMSVLLDIDKLHGADFVRRAEANIAAEEDEGDTSDDDDRQFSIARPGASDPVWSMIKSHQRALSTLNALIADHAAAEERVLHRALTPSEKREWRSIERRYQRALKKEGDVIEKLFETKPTSTLGAIALLEYVEGRIEKERAHEMLPDGAIVAMLRNVRSTLTPGYAQTIKKLLAEGLVSDAPEIPDCITFGAAA